MKIVISSKNIMKTPQYFIVGDRPVKFVETKDGGLDCQVYQWESGEFSIDMSYLIRCTQGEGDIDQFDEAVIQHHISFKLKIMLKILKQLAME